MIDHNNPERLLETVYRPESPIKKPMVLFVNMAQDLARSQYIAWRIFLRDVNARYRQTLLGFFWAFVPPVVVAVGFTWAGQAKVISVGSTLLPYPAYVMLSMVIWQTFTESVMGPVQAVTEAKSMLGKINFPREAIVLAKIWEVLLSFSIKLVLVAVLFIWYDLSVSWWAALAPLALLVLIGLGVTVGLLLAPLAALYQDVSRGLTLALGVWLFLTPVVYPVPVGDSVGANIIRANPVTPVLVTIRDLATGYDPTMLAPFAAVSVIVPVVLVLTWIGYRLAMPFVIERLGA
jgi:lipopolysaccharide transport system permease protein